LGKTPRRILSPALRTLLAVAALTLAALSWSFLPEVLLKRSSWSFSGQEIHGRSGEKVSTAGDVNGDGFSDVAIFSSGSGKNSGKIQVFLGSKNGPSRTPFFTQVGENSGDQYGHSFGGVGDLNGDGYGDFIAAAQNFDLPGARDAGKAYLYAGSPQGLLLPAVWTRAGEFPQELFGDCSAGVGDINGDGLPDVLVGAYGYALSRGRVHLFLGSRESFLSREPAWTGQGASAGDWYGYSVASAGDVNGDGRTDIVIGAKMARSGPLGKVGKVYVHYGVKGGLSLKPSWSASGERAYDMFGWRALSAGDVNGDGFSDILASAYSYDGPKGPDYGKAYLFLGSKTGLAQEPSWTFIGEEGGSMAGHSIGSGDLDSDGFSDILVGAPGGGKVFLFKGGSRGLPSQPDLALGGEGGSFGSYVGFAGDVNGDGFPDFLVGAPAFDGKGESSGKAYLFYGAKDLRKIALSP